MAPDNAGLKKDRSGPRWIWRALLVLLALLVIAHIGMNVTGGRRLESELRKIKASGQPLSHADAAPPPVPDAENAAALYLYVFRQETGPIDPHRLLSPKEWRPISKSFLGPDEKAISSFGSGPTTKPGTWPTAEQTKAAIARHTRDLALIRQASRMPYCRFPVNWQDGVKTILPHYAGLRDIVSLLAGKARFDAASGDSAAAFDDLETAARAIKQVCTGVTLIDELVRVSCVHIIASALPDVLAATPPSKAQAHSLAAVLQPLGVRGSLTTAMETERRSGIWMFDQVRRKGLWEWVTPLEPGRVVPSKPLIWRMWPVLRYAAEPVIRIDQTYYLQYMQKQIDLTRKPYAESRTGYALADQELEKAPKYAVVTRVVSPVFSHVNVRSDEGIAKANLMHAAMGLRIYQIEHGSYPSSLADLRKADWPVATDPFTGKDFVYRREGKGYIIYSLGPDQKEQGGLSLVEVRKTRPRPSLGREYEYDIPLRVTR